MKDRIRKVMESQQMTQQEFAAFIHISPASLSSIFTGRTRPTIATVEAIKKSLPDVSTEWLLFGVGDMYINKEKDPINEGSDHCGQAFNGNVNVGGESTLDFCASSTASTTPQITEGEGSLDSGNMSEQRRGGFRNGQVADNYEKMVKNIDIKQRTITEIRIFYSDQTWETFVPKK